MRPFDDRLAAFRQGVAVKGLAQARHQATAVVGGSKAVSALSRGGTPLLPPVSKLLLFSLQIGFVFAHLTCVSQETESLGEYCIGWLENVLEFFYGWMQYNNCLF